MSKPDFFNLPAFRKQTAAPAALMGLDYGKARIGIALTNPEQTMAFAHKTLNRTRKLQGTLEEISKLVKEWEVRGLVIGYPSNADGTESRMCQAVRQFTHNLLKLINNIPILLIDERYTSLDSSTDADAAVKILEKYLSLS